MDLTARVKISARESDSIWSDILEIAAKHNRSPETIARIAKARSKAKDNGSA
jgi:hypothetical protein